MSDNSGNGPESSEVADLLNGSLCVFVEELGLLHCFLEHYCTHPMLSCMLRSLYECQRLLTHAFHCGKRVYEIALCLPVRSLRVVQ